MSNKLFGIDLSNSAESQVEKQPDFDLQNNISGTSTSVVSYVYSSGIVARNDLLEDLTNYISNKIKF